MWECVKCGTASLREMINLEWDGVNEMVKMIHGMDYGQGKYWEGFLYR